MARVALFLSLVSLILTMGAVAQEQPPAGPFKAVHLVTLDAAQEAKLTGTLAQFNAAIAKAGYPNAQYRLYKVAGKQQGQYSHLWESSWSGRAEYEKIHNLPVYQQASSLLKDLMPMMKDEAYNRFVEIPTKQ
jgi:formylglycine-generating enzyme required for sulfatase activity